MKNDLIYLISVQRSQDKNGFYKDTYKRREMFAEVKTVTRSEHYNADRAGKRVQMVAVINDGDYQLAVMDEGVVESKKYEAETTFIDGRTENAAITPHRVIVPEYVEYESVRYRIERNYKDPKGTDRELTLIRED